MTYPTTNLVKLSNSIRRLLEEQYFTGLVDLLAPIAPENIALILERLTIREQAILYRLLPKGRAINVFELLTPGMQSDLISGLQDSEVALIFANLDPDDRVWLIDELPAGVAPMLLQGLSDKERQLTAEVLGYPKGSIGRRMTPEYVSTRSTYTVSFTLQRVQERLDDAEMIYTLPVLDDSRRVIGIVSLRDLLRADSKAYISEIMTSPDMVTAYQPAEVAARKCANLGHFAIPVVDKESRLVGVLTLDDAAKILEFEATEDAARQGGVEPLRRPYLATSVRELASSRILWLLVLAIGATLTVQVLSVFEETLEKVTVLALFVPLLIGTGGNTGNQAATTITRALALDDVRPQDTWRVFIRELGVGFSLGALLGGVGGLITGFAFDPTIGLVIGLTLLAVCSIAAAIGGIMPMLARSLRVDPAVFSNPFISTFVDASGLIIYFLIARAVLGI